MDEIARGRIRQVLVRNCVSNDHDKSSVAATILDDVDLFEAFCNVVQAKENKSKLLLTSKQVDVYVLNKKTRYTL